ncbi:hypothetical protein EDD17DRAFT_588978 [Pisolithus thermaeus]|nr:hypothetical protein EDD17DRAFT_588978 [Pisolithus thermaeus]
MERRGNRTGISLSRPLLLTRTGDDSHNFVDSVARQEAASEERRRQMHKFFQVCRLSFGCIVSLTPRQMPTEQKVREIQEIIKFLRAQHHSP